MSVETEYIRQSERPCVRELTNNITSRAVPAYNHLRSLTEDRTRAAVGNGTCDLLAAFPDDLQRILI